MVLARLSTAGLTQSTLCHVAQLHPVETKFRCSGIERLSESVLLIHLFIKRLAGKKKEIWYTGMFDFVPNAGAKVGICESTVEKPPHRGLRS